MGKPELKRIKTMTGQKPGKDTYVCQKCGQTVTLYDHTDTLPPCPDCHGILFYPYKAKNNSQYEAGCTRLPDYNN